MSLSFVVQEESLGLIDLEEFDFRLIIADLGKSFSELVTSKGTVTFWEIQTKL